MSLLMIQPTSGPGLGLRLQEIRVPVINRTGGTRTAGQCGAFAFDTTRGDAADVTSNSLDGSNTSGFSCLVALAAGDVIHGTIAAFLASTADNAEGMAVISGPRASVSVEDTAANTTLNLPLVIDVAQNANGLTADPVGAAVYKVFGYSLEATVISTNVATIRFNGFGFLTYTA